MLQYKSFEGAHIMGYKKANMWSNVLIFAGLFCAFLAYVFTSAGQYIAGILALILMAAAFIIKYKYWRCPHCGCMLPWRTIATPTYCMQCGNKLDDPPEAQ
jgi:DNA-directed RNA polymerase subunit RPC12/RpoP